MGEGSLREDRSSGRKGLSTLAVLCQLWGGQVNEEYHENEGASAGLHAISVVSPSRSSS